MLNKLLVPLDGSTLAESILPKVETLAKDFDAEIVLVRAEAFPVPAYTTLNPYLVPNFTQGEHTLSQAYLDRIATGLREKNFKVKVVSNTGRAADVILDTAEAMKVALIVMTTHGRSGVGRWLLGSVADEVVHAAKVPVLLVRSATQQPEAKPSATQQLQA